MTYSTEVTINRGDTLVCTGLPELGSDDLLDGQDDAVLAANPYGGSAVLDSLDGIFDLEVAAVGREDRVGQVVACSYRGLTIAGTVRSVTLLKDLNVSLAIRALGAGSRGRTWRGGAQLVTILKADAGPHGERSGGVGTAGIGSRSGGSFLKHEVSQLVCVVDSGGKGKR